MSKTKYFVIDPNGAKHTRTTGRVYTHAVVFRPDFTTTLLNVSDSGWTAVDRRNFKYEQEVAAGGGVRYKNWKAEYPDKYTAEQIEAEQATVDAANLKAETEAKLIVDGNDWEAYCESERLERVRKVHQKKADGYFDTYICAGWCGRLDLAQKLARNTTGGVDVTILDAQVVP